MSRCTRRRATRGMAQWALRVEVAQPTEFGFTATHPRLVRRAAPERQWRRGRFYRARPSTATRGSHANGRMATQSRSNLPMPVTRVYAHPAIAADVGSVTLQRGPLIYCLEQADQSAPLDRIVLPASAELTDRFVQELLGGVVRGQRHRTGAR